MDQENTWKRLYVFLFFFFCFFFLFNVAKIVFLSCLVIVSLVEQRPLLPSVRQKKTYFVRQPI